MTTSNLHLLCLPVKIRLAIYSWCPSFTLLQLAGTCTQIRHEITSQPDVINHAYYLMENPQRQWQRRFRALKLYGELSLSNIQVLDRAELDLFMEQAYNGNYPQQQRPGLHKRANKDIGDGLKHRYPCRTCLYLWDESYFRSSGMHEGGHCWDACFLCINHAFEDPLWNRDVEMMIPDKGHTSQPCSLISQWNPCGRFKRLCPVPSGTRFRNWFMRIADMRDDLGKDTEHVGMIEID
ncbi:hypothetical protein BJ508DRAFT_306994 [Ascobolus immersus RN42]|uniref:F-box domain-containing protein n=1 Tax=Ascobolus immersus RN42 TaxID=1160509 RepID=A0A3N4I4N0_ASCIM|nr:hypothetical protein BJ508DRAFT_306994 [Ascobolus immersus RN42]